MNLTTHCPPISCYSALPSHTLTPHYGTPMSLCSMLMRCHLIGHHNHSLSLTPVLFLLWPNDTLTNPWCPYHDEDTFLNFNSQTPFLFFPLARCVIRITHRPTFLLRGSISRPGDSHCTPQFCYLRNSSTLLILCGVTVKLEICGNPLTQLPLLVSSPSWLSFLYLD